MSAVLNTLAHWFLLALGGLGLVLMPIVAACFALALALEGIRSLRSRKRPQRRGE